MSRGFSTEYLNGVKLPGSVDALADTGGAFIKVLNWKIVTLWYVKKKARIFWRQ